MCMSWGAVSSPPKYAVRRIDVASWSSHRDGQRLGRRYTLLFIRNTYFERFFDYEDIIPIDSFGFVEPGDGYLGHASMCHTG